MLFGHVTQANAERWNNPQKLEEMKLGEYLEPSPLEIPDQKAIENGVLSP